MKLAEKMELEDKEALLDKLMDLGRHVSLSVNLCMTPCTISIDQPMCKIKAIVGTKKKFMYISAIYVHIMLMQRA